MTIKQLQQEVMSFRDERNWKKFHKPKDIIISLMTELGELTEHLLWKTDKQIEDYTKTKEFSHMKEEVCDVVFNAITLANSLDMDLEKEFMKKLKKNKKKYPVTIYYGKR